MNKINVTVSILASVLLLLYSGCSRSRSYEELSEGTELRFETIDWGTLLSDYRGKSPNIYVITDNQSPLIDSLDFRFAKSEIKSIDFSQYFVIAVFRGRTNVWDHWVIITNVWQDGKVVNVRAQLVKMDNSGTAPSTVLSQHSLKVSKKSMTQFGRITFRLLDDYGNERASTTAIITQGVDKK